MEDKHFDKVFWFVCGLCALAISVDLCVMFIPLSKTGEKFADNIIPVLNTGAMMSGIYYLLGGNPDKKKPTATTESGDITLKDGK